MEVAAWVLCIRRQKLERSVAVKFLPPHQSQAEDEKKRFIHEAKAVSALHHPNICTICEMAESDDGQMFIAMACYDGETLKKGRPPEVGGCHRYSYASGPGLGTRTKRKLFIVMLNLLT